MTTKTTNARISNTVISIFEHLDEDTMEYVHGLLEDPYDDNTREAIRKILMEELLSQFNVDGTVLCDSLFR